MMNKTYKVKSPAKINIGLRVISKRKDSYHNIETIFYPVKIYDEITLKIKKLKNSKSSIINVTTNLKRNLNNKNNICYKSVKLFLEEYKIKDKYKIDINIKKSVPVGAGLGGGSSNAASVLKTMAKYFNINHRLQKIGLKLGSDVPFFLLAKSAYASSRGEKLTLLPKFIIRHKILIVNPGIHVSTSWAYKELRIRNHKLKILDNIKSFNPQNEKLMINDFERVVFRKYPKIEKLKYDMYKYGAVYALMSGSGSTVYGFFTTGKIKAAEKYFRGFEYKTFIC